MVRRWPSGMEFGGEFERMAAPGRLVHHERAAEMGSRERVPVQTFRTDG